MKYLKLYEAYHAPGYKEEVAAEQEKLRIASELYRKEEERYQKSMKDIQDKWKDENARFKDKILNTIDICLEPLTDKWSLSEPEDEDHEFHYYDSKSYIPSEHTTLVITPELVNDLSRASKRLKSELPNAKIYVFVWAEGGDWITSMLRGTLVGNIEPISKYEGPDSGIDLDWLVNNIDEINKSLTPYIHKRWAQEGDTRFTRFNSKMDLLAILVEAK